MTSSQATRAFINAARAARLDYAGFLAATGAARAALGLVRPPRGQRLPHLLTAADLGRFYQTIDQEGNVQHQLLLRLMLFSAVRVAELTNIRVEDVDVPGGQIFIHQGKGSKDRRVLFPDSFRLPLQIHLAANPANRFLFESRLKTKFSTRHVQRIVAHYAAAAELPVKMHPHLLRHQMLTFLTKAGLTDAQIQLVSGHASKKSLEIYQHLSLGDVAGDYQQAVKGLGV